MDFKPNEKSTFFPVFALTSPHTPIVPIKNWRGKSGAGAYGDYMMQSDWTVGEILKALKRYGFEDNTIVIFTSDNGPERYAYDRVKNYGHYSMGNLRGVKRDIWEGGHRVPFLVKWPDIIKPGTVSNVLISQIDLMATLASATDIILPAGAAGDSYNQKNVLKGMSGSTRPSMVYNTFDNYAIQKENWVLIDAKNGQHSRMPEWFSNQYENDTSSAVLYNLSNDISQRINLISVYPEKADELRRELKKIIENN
jgi:arylsulfatase A